MNRSTLPQSEKASLIRAAQSGDISARNALIEADMGLIYATTRKYAPKGQADEFMAFGVEAYMNAVMKFRPDRHTWLSTYAHRAIQRRVRTAVSMGFGGGVFRFSPHRISDKTRSAYVAARTLTRGLDPEAYLVTAKANEYEGLDAEQATATLRRLVDRLPDRERDVLRMRLNGLTLNEIGRSWGLCRERIRQIETKAVRMLSRMFEAEAA